MAGLLITREDPIQEQYSNPNLSKDATISELVRRAGISSAIVKVQTLEAGMLNKVMRISFSNRPDVVIRIRQFQDAEYGQEFAAERFVYPMLNGRGVRVPQLLYCSADDPHCETLFAVFEFVSGELIGSSFQDGTFDRHRVFNLLANIAASLKEIHTVKRLGYGTQRSISHTADERRRFFEELFEREAQRLRNLQLGFAAAFDRVMSRWLDLIELLPESLGGPTLVHGDVHGHNLIVRDDEVVFIDWEASRFRIAPYDLAQFRYLNLRHDTEVSQFLIRAYLENSSESIDRKVFSEVVDVCQYFWQCRMGLFFLQFPQFETPYFGTAKEHLESVEAGIKSFST